MNWWGRRLRLAHAFAQIFGNGTLDVIAQLGVQLAATSNWMRN